MKILHCGSIDIKTGGPALSTSLSMRGVLLYGITPAIWQEPLREEGSLITNDFRVYPQKTTSLRDISGVDIYHIQGIWMRKNHEMAKFARGSGKPYIITLRGMLYPQALIGNGYFKKKIALLLYQRKDLQKATCIQATCIEEKNYYRSLGFTNPVAVIPNPIDTRGIIERPIPVKSKIRFGFLGRLDPRKHVERLIYSFDSNRDFFKDAELVIMGSWDNEYESFLKKEVQRLRLSNVQFTGFISGKAKDDAINSLSALVVPSDFENFGNIVTEALVRGVPVIASRGTPWHELEEFKCGYWINNDQDSINKTMLDFFLLSNEEKMNMGYNAKRLVTERYSLEKNGADLASLYNWIIGNGVKPAFVYF